MGSLLTNTASMVALSTLRGINKNLSAVQSQISTGKSVSNARDNAAVYAISSVMSSDVKGFEAIGASLSLGSSSVAVARGAAEKVTDLLQEIKGSIVAAQEDIVDRAKIQEDVSRLRDQITSIVDAAQFNGLNLLKDFESIDVLASLDRASDQSLSASKIQIDRFNLTTEAGSYNNSGTVFTGTGIAFSDIGGAAGADNVARVQNVDIAETGTGLVDGDAFTLQIGDNSFSFEVTDQANTDEDTVRDALVSQINAAGIDGITATTDANAGRIIIQNTNKFESYDISVSTTADGTNGGTVDVVGEGGAAGASDSGSVEQRAEVVEILGRQVNAGDGYRLTLAGTRFDYIAKEGDDINDVAAGLKAAIDEKAPTLTSTENVSVKVKVALDPTNSTDKALLYIDNDSATATAITVEARQDGDSTGGLRALQSIDVSTADGASRALDNIENLIQTSIDAASSFGSAQKRIDIQSDFIKDLTDALKSGIGSLVDADLEEASARLQSLQVQQQLGIQALSIANQNPQTLLALFR